MDVRQQSRPQDSAPVSSTRESTRHRGWMGSKWFYWLLTALIVLGILAILAKAYMAIAANRAVSGKEYQALFLTNGQVYFGHLSQTQDSYVKLKDIYYLQVQQTVQPADKSSSSTTNQQVSLAKLGTELHGPEDTMYVSREQVLFWENLKNDGKVAKAIQQYIDSQKK